MTDMQLQLHVRQSRKHRQWHGRPDMTWSVLHRAVVVLLQRWRPAELSVTRTRFDEYEQPEQPGRTVQIDVRAAAASADELIDAHEVIAADPLDVRVAVPASGAHGNTIWFVDPDQHERQAQLLDAPDLDGLNTRWLRPDCPLQRGFVLYIPERGVVDVQWDPGLFAGTSDVSEWSELDRRVDEILETSLRELGFESPEHPPRG